MYVNHPTRLLQLLLPVLLFFLGIQETAGKHIVGGEMYYTCLGPGSQTNTRNFRLTMTLYRDCSTDGALFDSPAQIGVYSYINGTYAFVRFVNVNRGEVSRVESNENPCLIVPDDVCVQETSYTFDLNNLAIINGSYIISWQRCCRNNTINNIVAPHNTGATFMVEITDESQRTCNSSPRFDQFPPIAICVNDPINFDHSATDMEGDQIVYEFCAPLQGGGPLGTDNPNQIRWCEGIIPDPAVCLPPYDDVIFLAPNYSAINPLGTVSPIAIHPVSGFISGSPALIGQFVVGVCVREYRNGILLSVLRRDFQFNVLECETTVEARIDADAVVNGKEFILNSCGNNTITFINQSFDQQYIQSYRWTFNINGQPQVVTTRDATYTFPGIGTYVGTMILNAGGLCGDTASINVNIYPSINADFEFDYDTCIGGPVSFKDLSKTEAQSLSSWDWDFGDSEDSDVRNPNHLYQSPGVHPVQLIATDNNDCKDTVMQEINYFPVPPLILIKPSKFTACVPEVIQFTNLSVPIDDTYDIRWDFGDGGTGSDINPVYEFEDVGTFTVKVEITSPIGCYTSETFNNLITMEPSPEAGFTFTPETINSINPTASFFDLSTGGTGWFWDFGGEGSSFIREPVFTFRDSGLHQIMQVVFHPNGCTDTMIQNIDIESVVQFFLPNAFTPNFDGKNETYKPGGLGAGARYYSLGIWTRWGEKVFETGDPEEGWNGRKNNSGQDLPVGVYLCVLQYRDARNRPFELREFVTLIR